MGMAERVLSARDVNAMSACGLRRPGKGPRKRLFPGEAGPYASR